METNQANTASIATPKTHPMLLVAATSVTLLSLAGVGALAGWLPGPAGQKADTGNVTLAAAQIPPVAPVSVQQNVTVPHEKAQAAAKPARREPVSARRTTPVAETREIADSPAPTFRTSAPPPICRDCGVVETVREVAVEPKGSGGGAVAGGVVGGIIGNQIGKGATRDIATIIGAVGGAYAGNHIEKSTKQSKRYDVVVRFEDGSTRIFSSDSLPSWQSGDQVRVQNGLLTIGGGSRSASNVAI